MDSQQEVSTRDSSDIIQERKQPDRKEYFRRLAEELPTEYFSDKA
jgi:hypothetical protein